MTVKYGPSLRLRALMSIFLILPLTFVVRGAIILSKDINIALDDISQYQTQRRELQAVISAPNSIVYGDGRYL